MEVVITYLGDLLSRMFQTVVASLLHNWYVLGLSIIIAVGLKVYVNTEKLSSLLMRRRKVSVIASVLFGAFTPLCACGTSAVLIGMLTTTLCFLFLLYANTGTSLCLFCTNTGAIPCLR